jgi:hypothetical protein
MVQGTSIATYYDLHEEGIIGEMQLTVLNHIKGHAGNTDRENAFELGFGDPNHIRPRRKELVDLGLVRNAGRRDCKITKRQALTWEAVPDWEIEAVRAKRNQVKCVCPTCGGRGIINPGQQTL